MAKHEHSPEREAELIKEFSTTRVSLKIMPDVNGSVARRQLVTYTPQILRIQEVWQGPARIHLVPHVNAPIADFPILETLGATHLICDMALPLGGVIHDYLLTA
jgi:acetoacetate decarboxylase